MKKILILPAFLLLMSGCGGRSADEQAAEQKSNDDSVTVAVTAKEAAERARLDSIRQDSIEKAQKIIASIPTFSEMERAVICGDAPQISSFFKGKGFDVILRSHKETVTVEEAENYLGPGDLTPGTYTIYDPVKATLNKGGEPSCEFREIYDGEMYDGWKITINGAPEVLSKFIVDAKAYIAKLKRKHDGYHEFCTVTVSGNTVTFHYPGFE